MAAFSFAIAVTVLLSIVYHVNCRHIIHEHHIEKRSLTKCYPDIGCFSTGGAFYHPVWRAINLLPQSPEHIDPKFLLYTRKNPKEGQRLGYKDEQSVKGSYFNPAWPTKIVVHGFLDSTFLGDWMKIMKDEYLFKGDFNVITCDWSKGNFFPYTQATANTRVVGALMALLVKNLQTAGASPSSIHILGHSLGSHIAGYAGERIKGLGRITGLDPAGPYFEFLPAEVRLDPTDADFVDAIHSNAKRNLVDIIGLGQAEPCGHVDFYPNGGATQPGCDRDRITKFFTDGIKEGARRFIACDHQRAVDYYLAALNHPQCAMVAYQCTDFGIFSGGRCADCGYKGDRCATLGPDAINFKKFTNAHKSIKMFFKTSDAYPFCQFQYQVQVKLAASKGKDTKGKFTIVFHGSKSTQKFQLSSSEEQLYPGSTYTYLVTTNHFIGDIENIQFQWDKSLSFSKSDLYIEHVQVKPMFDPNRTSTESKVKSFCQNSTFLPIKQHTTVTFEKYC